MLTTPIHKPRSRWAVIGVMLVAAVMARETTEAGGLCIRCDSGETVMSQFSPPPGFSRVSAADQGFASWLRNLPLLPSDQTALDWRGNSVFQPGDVAGVLDWRLLGEVEQCADVAIRLVAEFMESNGDGDRLTFRSLSGQRIDWSKWLRGNYGVDDAGAVIEYHPASLRQKSRTEFDRYLTFVMTYANTASLRDEWMPVEDSVLRAGDVLIQPGCPGSGMGHLSIILDACEDVTGARLYLFADGYTPARMPVIRQQVESDPASAWMTVPEYQALQSQFGIGRF
ncbi:MAG: DUF4846 domain-containing protein, partial [Candidatus Zixiibacteriota bacterium]